MAFENFPEAEKTPTTERTSTSRRANTIRGVLLGVMAAALIGTWVYIIWDKNNTRESLAQKDNLITTTSTERDELQKELADATMRYDMLKTSNSKKDSAITAKDREIDEKTQRIQSLLSKANASERELGQARSLIASLRGDIEGYKNQIEMLEGQKVQLAQEKMVVTQERDRVIRDFDSAKVVIREKEDIIDVGSTLHASNFNIVGINEKSGGKEKVTDKAKRVDKLRVSFDLDENMITPSGNKEIYIVITAPDGNTIAVESLGSGTFNTREGEEKMFTQKLDVNYVQNTRQTVSFDWKHESDFATGNYKIEVYNNGFKVGEGYRPLKKGGLFS